RWTSKSKNLSLVSGLAAGNGTVVVRQGLYADANDYGAPTTIVTQTWGRTFVEEPEVYIKEDPYGFVGLDPATGKESWSCVDFEAADPDFKGAMPPDNTVCGGGGAGAQVKKDTGLNPSKLRVGGVPCAGARRATAD